MLYYKIYINIIILDLSIVEKAVNQDAVLPCLGWTGDHMARGEHVLVRWLRVLPTGEKEILEELEVPTEPSVLAEVGLLIGY